jgi:hypothetical protein
LTRHEHLQKLTIWPIAVWTGPNGLVLDGLGDHLRNRQAWSIRANRMFPPACGSVAGRQRQGDELHNELGMEALLQDYGLAITCLAQLNANYV